MIQLPPLSITRDERQEVLLLQKARAWLEEGDRLREPGIHASDLLDPRLAYWQWADPKPLSERKVWLFLIGRVLHGFVVQAMDPEQEKTATDSGAHEELGILYSPDIMRSGRPIELKTSRIYEVPPDEVLQEEWRIYFEQLSTYLILTNRLTGYLWVLLINLREEGTRRTFPEPRCYRVELTRAQFHQIEDVVVRTRDLLIQAKAERDHRSLPLCRSWLCGPQQCVFWNACRPEGRWPQEDKRRWTA